MCPRNGVHLTLSSWKALDSQNPSDKVLAIQKSPICGENPVVERGTIPCPCVYCWVSLPKGSSCTQVQGGRKGYFILYNRKKSEPLLKSLAYCRHRREGGGNPLVAMSMGIRQRGLLPPDPLPMQWWTDMGGTGVSELG